MPSIAAEEHGHPARALDASASLTEKEKMLLGMTFDCMDPELTRARLRIRPLLQALDTLPWPALPEDPSLVPDTFGDERR